MKKTDDTERNGNDRRVFARWGRGGGGIVVMCGVELSMIQNEVIRRCVGCYSILAISCFFPIFLRKDADGIPEAASRNVDAAEEAPEDEFGAKDFREQMKLKLGALS